METFAAGAGGQYSQRPAWPEGDHHAQQDHAAGVFAGRIMLSSNVAGALAGMAPLRPFLKPQA